MRETRASSLALPKRGRLRVWLAGLGAAAMAMAIASSCASPFDPPSEIEALRILSVDATRICPTADDPDAICPGGTAGAYALPGDTIRFDMSFAHALGDSAGNLPQITWLGGCFDPDGDAYYGCYASLADTLQQIASGSVDPLSLPIAQGPGLSTFDLTIPADIVSRKPPPATGPYSGSAFVFFAVCAGSVQPIAQEGTSVAGSFPLGCFDAQGTRLGADSFVVGYTQVYAFDDERQNDNPPIDSLDFDGAPAGVDPTAEPPHIKACSVGADKRAQSGCAAPNEFAECATAKITVDVPHDIGEVDPAGEGQKGETLHEVVWVSYFADGGNFDSDSKLISDATTGYKGLQEVEWVPPEEPDTYTLWAVVRDSRGGSSTVKTSVVVDP